MTHNLAQRIAKAGEPSGGVKWTAAEVEQAKLDMWGGGEAHPSRFSYGTLAQVSIDAMCERNCLRAALEEIAGLDYTKAATNGCAHTAVMLAKGTLDRTK